MSSKPRKIMLTFDIEGWPPKEDYFDEASAGCLREVLNLLKDMKFHGVFFVTGSIAERLREYPDIRDMLCRHTIGYHSSAHNAWPGIIGLTDVPSYEMAYNLSMKRETSHVNPENGEINGKGGLFALKETFPNKNIQSFRAPFFGWSPPHLEAIRKLGIKYDFSAHICADPVIYREIIFFPTPLAVDTMGLMYFQRRNNGFPRILMEMILRQKLTILSLHPSALLFKECFEETRRHPRGRIMLKLTMFSLKLLLKQIRFLQMLNLVEVAPLDVTYQSLDLGRIDVRRIYEMSVRTPAKIFNYYPKHVYSHFHSFFKSNEANVQHANRTSN